MDMPEEWRRPEDGHADMKRRDEIVDEELPKLKDAFVQVAEPFHLRPNLHHPAVQEFLYETVGRVSTLGQETGMPWGEVQDVMLLQAFWAGYQAGKDGIHLSECPCGSPNPMMN
jgi:hypothetical protein